MRWTREEDSKTDRQTYAGNSAEYRRQRKYAGRVLDRQT